MPDACARKTRSEWARRGFHPPKLLYSTCQVFGSTYAQASISAFRYTVSRCRRPVVERTEGHRAPAPMSRAKRLFPGDWHAFGHRKPAGHSVEPNKARITCRAGYLSLAVHTTLTGPIQTMLGDLPTGRGMTPSASSRRPEAARPLGDCWTTTFVHGQACPFSPLLVPPPLPVRFLPRPFACLGLARTPDFAGVIWRTWTFAKVSIGSIVRVCARTENLN